MEEVMYFKKCVPFIISLAMASPALALDYDNMYYNVFGGWSKLKSVDHDPAISASELKSTSKAVILGGAVGYYLYDNLRTEIGVDTRFNQMIYNAQESYKLTISTLHLNALYDIADLRGFVPYLGVGVGGSHVMGHLKRRVANSTKVKSTFNLHSRIIAGSYLHLRDGLRFDAQYGYKYFGQLNKKPRAKLYAHEVTLGFLFKL